MVDSPDSPSFYNKSPVVVGIGGERELSDTKHYSISGLVTV